MDERKPNRLLREVSKARSLKTLLVDLKNYLKTTTLMFQMKSTMYLKIKRSKIEELEKKLNESIEKNVELNKANGELKRQDIIDETSEDLA